LSFWLTWRRSQPWGTGDEAGLAILVSGGSDGRGSVGCHSALEGALSAPAEGYANDIHGRFQFSCSDCHGGDRSADDPTVAMNRARGFTGKPSRAAIPQLCARCHADAALMHKYNPQERVDQYALYLTSTHGKRIAAGDTAAAVCTDCHGVHGIREVKDGQSPVHPLRLPSTCARCHSDPKHMAKYQIPTNQLAEYQKSVHWEALQKRGDLSAPSCASCHGNHGATPPGVSSVAAVCGTCHVLMENLYNKSPHQAAFAAMNARGCVVCHTNHAVLKPSDKMLAGPGAVCSQCHEAASPGGIAADEMAGSIQKLEAAIAGSDAILSDAARSGMEVSEALLRQNDANEALVKARVAVHAFRAAAVSEPVGQGLKTAAETHQAGQQALLERNRRRIGLGVALVTILIVIGGLWLAIRRLEDRPVG
jgi:hypothetical protein